MSDVVKFELSNQIAKITLQNGKVNAISHEVIEALHSALDQAEEAGATVILSGQPGILSGGFDLKTMRAGREEAVGLVTAGSKLTRRMIAFPTPIITVCTGHAVAKGCFLLLSSDYRLGAKGDFKLGLNEVAIGITMHYAGVAMAKHRMPKSFYNRSVNLAEMFDPETAVEAGILDEVLPADALMARAEQVAQYFNETLKMKTHHETKVKARAEFIEEMDRAIELDLDAQI